jgi:hypothetical protein
MAAVVAFVTEQPGWSSFKVAHALLPTSAVNAPTTRPFKLVQSAIARAIRDRHVRHVDDRLYPWDVVRFEAATRAEQAAIALTSPSERTSALLIAAERWAEAGDPNRASALERLADVAASTVGGSDAL